MAAHTPGPWSVGSHRSIQSQAGTICETFSHMGVEVADANERLIAAAPELLDVLMWIADQPQGAMFAEVREVARDAIAKATGKAA